MSDPRRPNSRPPGNGYPQDPRQNAASRAGTEGDENWEEWGTQTTREKYNERITYKHMWSCENYGMFTLLRLLHSYFKCSRTTSYRKNHTISRLRSTALLADLDHSRVFLLMMIRTVTSCLMTVGNSSSKYTHLEPRASQRRLCCCKIGCSHTYMKRVLYALKYILRSQALN